MGTCTCKPAKNIKRNTTGQQKSQQSNPLSYISKQNKEQIHCLKLIYEDLASRCPQRLMNSKTFQIFFHMNKVIGGSLFRKFFKSNSNCPITEEMFIQAVLQFSKQEIEEKMKFLFSLFDLNESKGVSFNELLAIFLNYPQEQMKQILSKEEFLQSLTIQQMSYYLISSKKMDPEKLQKQYKSSLTLFPHLAIRKKSSTFQMDRNQLFEQNYYTSQQKQFVNEHMDKIREKKLIKNQFKNNIDKTLLTTQMFKKYIEYIFKINHLDRQHDQISFQIFKHILKDHPKLYQEPFEGFHSYLWRYEHGVGLFKKKVPHISGFCIEVFGTSKRRIYLVNIKNSLMIFENQQMKKPISIKNLEGLTVQETQNNEGFGFILRHQDGIYQECSFYFSKKQIQLEWLNQLKQFQPKDFNKKYLILEKIGKGSFSIVYKCQSLQNGQKRAMKKVQKQGRTQEQIAAIHYESEILATCVMPNVLRAFQRFQDKSYIYLVTQLIDGGTLYEYVRKKHTKHLEQSKVKSIMKQLVSTIKDLHGIGIIHRDLKLENILMKYQDRKQYPKIIDFGLAIHIIDLPNINEKNRFAGTPNFVAPEIFIHAQYDQTIDVFSLGVIMHFLLTGFLPFHGVDFDTIRQLTLQCFINYQSKYWQKTSQQAKDLLSKMICYRQHRITASQALSHQWFHQNNPQSH